MFSHSRNLGAALFALVALSFASLSAVRADSGPAGNVSPAVSAAQVSTGRALYAGNCAACHGTHLEGISAPPLLSSADDPRTVSETYAVASRMMPKNRPGSLAPEAYVAIVAYLIAENGCAPGSTMLTADIAKTTTAQLGCAARLSNGALRDRSRCSTRRCRRADSRRR